MPAVRVVQVEGFRCFDQLRVEGLTRVNLIVGANNSGKSALLEAIEATLSEESPYVLYRASYERGEYQRRERAGERVVEIDVAHWFHGHRLEDGAAFTLRAEGDRRWELRRVLRKVPTELGAPFVPGGLLLEMERTGGRLSNGMMPPLPISADGTLGAGDPAKFVGHGLRLKPPVVFGTTDRLFPRELARLWSGVVLTPREERIVEALRMVDPRVERIAISESGGMANAKVLLRGATTPVPLGTLGEGVSRILTLALNLALAEGGFLLLDEIEIGLHWSVMPRLWRFLIETARALDVQVFATTHSKDCLEGLGEVHRSAPVLAEDVSVHRLEAGRQESVRFSARRIGEYADLALEPR
ncbi:MAG: AAA family ATPase [Labilithrix sp.]|nr:AAA family ATPase [Labilithrix sp.]MCW5810693.1 AAA family ATPase [Labilithrix sp.]